MGQLIELNDTKYNYYVTVVIHRIAYIYKIDEITLYNWCINEVACNIECNCNNYSDTQRQGFVR